MVFDSLAVVRHEGPEGPVEEVEEEEEDREQVQEYRINVSHLKG